MKKQVREARKESTSQARVQNASVPVINESDLDRVSGGGGASGGVLGDRR